MNIDTVTVNVRIFIAGESVPLWRVRLLGMVARMLGVRFDVETLVR